VCPAAVGGVATTSMDDLCGITVVAAGIAAVAATGITVLAAVGIAAVITESLAMAVFSTAAVDAELLVAATFDVLFAVGIAAVVAFADGFAATCITLAADGIAAFLNTSTK